MRGGLAPSVARAATAGQSKLWWLKSSLNNAARNEESPSPAPMAKATTHSRASFFGGRQPYGALWRSSDSSMNVPADTNET